MDLDVLFGQLAITTMSVVGRSALSAASGLALRRVADYLQTQRQQNTSRISSTPQKDEPLKDQENPWERLARAHARLQAALDMVMPAIDLCEMRAAQGDVALARASTLASPLRTELQALSAELAEPREDSPAEAAAVATQLEMILATVDRLVPYLNLVLTTAGLTQAAAGGSGDEIGGVGRLLRASNLLCEASRRAREAGRAAAWVDVAAPLPARLYCLFSASARPKAFADWTWREEFPRCWVQLGRRRTGASVGAYELLITENLDDGRWHEAGRSSPPPPAAGAATEHRALLAERIPGAQLGASRVVPVEHLRSLTYALSGELLRIEDSRRPVLVVRVSRGSVAPGPVDKTPQRVSVNGHDEWLAIEAEGVSSVNGGDSSGDSDSSGEAASGDETGVDSSPSKAVLAGRTRAALNRAAAAAEMSAAAAKPTSSVSGIHVKSGGGSAGQLRLLDQLLRLAAIETVEGVGHLELSDDKLALHLSAAAARPDHAAGSGVPAPAPAPAWQLASPSPSETGSSAPLAALSPTRATGGRTMASSLNMSTPFQTPRHRISSRVRPLGDGASPRASIGSSGPSGVAGEPQQDRSRPN